MMNLEKAMLLLSFFASYPGNFYIHASCPRNHFECVDGSGCVNKYDFCNGIPQCLDWSDEVKYDESIHTDEDGIPCSNFVEPVHECFLPTSQSYMNHTFCRDSECTYMFKCNEHSSCIPFHNFCDGERNCRGGEDEKIYNASLHTKEDGVPCVPSKDGRGYCLLPIRNVCDGIINCYTFNDECECENSAIFCDGIVDCEFGTDECFCNNSIRSSQIKSDHKCFQCLDGSKIISSSQVCDNIIQCDDLSDECLCLHQQLPHLDELCKNIYDKPAQLLNNCTSFTTNDATNCLSTKLVCNGRLDEKSGIDEIFCPQLSNTKVCTDDEQELKLGHPKCDYTCYSTGIRAIKCDGFATCKEFEDECFSDCENPPLFCKYVHSYGSYKAFECEDDDRIIPIFAEHVCNGYEGCLDGKDEIHCNHRFYCEGRSPIHIPIYKTCDLTKDCDDESDELLCEDNTADCTGIGNKTDSCTLTHFYCNDNGTTKYLDRRKQVCDGTEQCLSGVDECQNCTAGIFSNDDSMISSKPLIPFLWLISILAVIGNVMVITLSSKHLINSMNSSRMEINQNVLVWNLAVADLFVGIYTLIISIQNVRLSKNRYCLEDQQWRSSSLCSALGILLLIGSEQSVFSLCIITGFRMKAVLRPLSHSRVRFIIMWMIFAWITSIILATVPLLASARNYFTEIICRNCCLCRYSQNPLVSSIRREDLTIFNARFLSMMNQTFESDDLSSWTLLESLLLQLNPSHTPDRRFGFYSSHGVCLPRLFPDPANDAAWGYSLLFILINFFAFVYIFVGYLVIYINATKSNALVSSTVSSTRAAAMQKKVTRIVVTDFLCWMPVCLMALLQLFGVNIPNEVYVPVGTILIPINSALNPFLYSEVPDFLAKRFEPVWRYVTRSSNRLLHSSDETQMPNNATTNTELAPCIGRYAVQEL